MSHQFNDKVLLVTGAAGDVGAAFTRLACAGGASVIAVDLHRERLDDLAAGVTDGPGTLVTEVGDVADHEAVRGVVERGTQRFGRLDGCFHNIATSHAAAALPDSSLDPWEHVLRVNAYGCFYVLKYVLGASSDPGRSSPRRRRPGFAGGCRPGMPPIAPRSMR